MSLVLDTSHASDAIEATLAVELLPPGPALDAEVARVLGVEPLWTVPGLEGDPWDSEKDLRQAFRHLIRRVDREPVVVHKPYSTDATASAEARELAFKKGMGFVVVMRSASGYLACRQGDPCDLMDERDAVTYDGDSVSFFADSELVLGVSTAHVVSLAIVGGAG